MTDRGPREEVARAARKLVAAGMISAFGHVSVRVGDRLLITPTTPLAELDPSAVLDLPLAEPPERERPPVPIEVALHRAIYRRRTDVTAICRHHAPWCVAWGVGTGVPPLLHGLGALSGDVAVHADPQLVGDAESADRAATALGDGASLLLTRNGAVNVGDSLARAYARAWFLEDRCRVALTAAGDSTELRGDDLTTRAAHSEPEFVRATAWAEHELAAVPDPPTP